MSKIEDVIVDYIKNDGTFYASLLSQMHRFADAKKTQGLAVNIKNGRINLFYNPEYLEAMPMKDTKLDLEHECLHLVMEHPIRAKDKDPEKWHVACDLAINQLMTRPPKGGLTLESIFGEDMHKYNLERRREAEYYYTLLEKSSKAKENIKKMKGEGKLGCSDQMGQGSSDGTGEDTIESLEGVDPELAKEIIKQAVGEAVKSAKGQGQLPAGLEQYIEQLFQPPKISWRQVLRRFVANSIKSGSKPSWKKPSRRYGDQQKGRIADRTVSLTLVIDTSGSINDEMLQLFMDEVTGIQKSYKSTITVLECDAKVHREYKLKKFEKLKKDVHGRGGTSFKPPFVYIKEKNIRTDALIYFTDLEGDFPDRKPNVPVLWAYYNYGYRNETHVPFGTVIELEKEKTK